MADSFVPDSFVPDRPTRKPAEPNLRQRLTAPVNAVLGTARGVVQPLANELARGLTFAPSGPFGSAPPSAIGRGAASVLNPMPGDLQDLGMLGASMAAGPLARPLSKGLGMVARPAITALGSLAGGALQGATDYTKPLIGAAIGGAMELPGFFASAFAPRLGRQADNTAAAGYLSEASGSPVPATRAGLAAARQETGAGSLAEPAWATYRQTFKDAIAATEDRPVSVTTSRPGEPPTQELMPLSQAWDRMSTLPEWFQKRKMMEEIVASLKTPLGALPAAPEAAAAIEGAGAPVRRTMSALQLPEGKGLNPATGDVNIAEWQARHQLQLQGEGAYDMPPSLQEPARTLLRRGDPTAAIDQPGHFPGGIREGMGTTASRVFFNPAELISGRLPTRVGETPLDLSGLTPGLLGPSYGNGSGPSSLGAMPMPQPPPPTNPNTMTLSAPGPSASPQPDVLAIMRQMELERAQRDMLGQGPEQ